MVVVVGDERSEERRQERRDGEHHEQGARQGDAGPPRVRAVELYLLVPWRTRGSDFGATRGRVADGAAFYTGRFMRKPNVVAGQMRLSVGGIAGWTSRRWLGIILKNDGKVAPAGGHASR